MDFSKYYISDALGSGTAGVTTEHIPRLGAEISRLDRMMLAAPEFLNRLLSQERNLINQFLVAYTVNIWLHAMAIRDTLLIVREDNGRMWNWPALNAQSRALQESYTSLFYFCAERVDHDEKEMRTLLMLRQFLSKRQHFASEIQIDQLPEKVAESLKNEAADLAKMQAHLESCPRIKSLLSHPDASVRNQAKRVLKKSDEYFLESAEQIWSRAGFDAKQYGMTWRFLSQYVHATPFGVASLLTATKESEDSSSRVLLAVVLAVWTFARAVRAAVAEFPATEHAAKAILQETEI